jgi:hypothetical protein
MFTTVLRALSLLRALCQPARRPPAGGDGIDPADFTWVGPVGGDWSLAANWVPAVRPRPGDTVVFRPALAPAAGPLHGGEKKGQ